MATAQIKSSETSSEMLASYSLRIRQQIASKWPALAIALYHHRNTRGEAMTFDDRHALLSIYKDDARQLVVRKCVQFGGSEMLLCKMLSKMYAGWAVLYSFPTEQLRNTYVANRIDPLLQIVPLYKSGLRNARGESDQVGLKHIWNGSVRFVGSNSKVGFVEYPADFVIIDELDASNIRNLALAPDRLQASPHKYFWQIGNPTIPNYGIDKAYRESDAKQWKIKCPRCGEWQVLDFFKNVVNQIKENQFELIDADCNLVCAKCHKPIDRLGVGQWIAAHPGREVSGYHISQLFSPTVSAKELYERFQAALMDQTKMQVFYNSDLGLPYEGAGDKLTQSILDVKAKCDYQMPTRGEHCTAGIDVNYPWLNVRISDYIEGKRRAVFIGKVNGFERLGYLLDRYNVETAVIDVAPERHKVEEFQAGIPIIWACQYTSTPNPENIESYLANAESKFRSSGIRRISIDRTMIIDATVADVIRGNTMLPINYASIDDEEYLSNLEAPTRIRDTNSKYPRYVWDEGDSPDHYFHADVYDYLASLIRDKIGDLTPGYA